MCETVESGRDAEPEDDIRSIATDVPVEIKLFDYRLKERAAASEHNLLTKIQPH